uniref:glucan endo-1,3-beta-D-glucosidase n=1 Tax=Achlya hypogyna TaxID=1202772 RepID=A0A0A7CP21_ACHHY|nr:secreted protein [Achlya hypogyna]
MILWALAIAALQTTVAGLGVCYDSYDPARVATHFATIQQGFSIVRIQRHPGTVSIVFVGNEELSNGWNADQLLAQINAVKSQLKAAGINVPVGTVQIDGDWLNNKGLAAACDVVGVNIHPFYGTSPASKSNPIEDLKTRWAAMVSVFGAKTQLVETGWPHQGNAENGHVPSDSTAASFFGQVQSWVASGNGGTQPTYFMFHDNPNKGVNTPEGSFGLADANGNWKLNIGSSDNGGNTQSTADPYNLLVPFQLVTTKGKVVYEYAHVLHAYTNAHQFQDLWYYNKATMQIKSRSDGLCIDAFLGDDKKYYVHLYDCGDGSNGNQKWSLQNQKVVHAVHPNLCLDADPTDPNQGIQVWECVSGNTNQIFTVTAETHHMTLASGNLVLAVQGNSDQVQFRPVQGSMAAVYSDASALWTLDPSTGLMKSETTSQCLDAYQPKNGGAIHTYACDPNNRNQIWRYDPLTQQLRHVSHQGYCLDLGSASGATPYIWTCHTPGDTWMTYQKFTYTV